MRVIRVVGTLVLALGFSLAGITRAMDCSGLPTSFTGNEFPAGDFFSNFNNPCYTIHLGTGIGNIKYGDLNATYYQLYFRVDPRYQLIVVGAFPNTRYFSISLNDEHSALSQSILDTDIVPLSSQYINPYLPGVAYIDGQQYAVPVNFGGTPGNQETGCMMNGYNADVNALDATQRHPGMDWNSDADLFQQTPNFVKHVIDTPQHTNPNTAGVVMIRAYMNLSPSNYGANPHVIVRDVASGCAYPADYVLNTLQIVTAKASTGSPWLDQVQFEAHHRYENDYLPKLCNASRPSSNSLRWSRLPEYVPATNPNASYIVAAVPAGLPDTLAAAREVMRIRIRIPTAPPTPCTSGCTRSGNEQARYTSLSFSDPGGYTKVSLADTAFTKDPNGYATLIVGTGAAIPKWITPANGYTFLDLTAVEGYQQLSLLSLRHIIPGNGFTCAGQYVPYRTSVDTPVGSLLGDYTPVVDYPLASSLPKKASALVGLSACGVYPAGEAGLLGQCGVFPEPPPTITSVVTQCTGPGCDQFVAQSNPPITILGGGFGTFPGGAPFTGTTSYIGLKDLTQNWRSGYDGTTCSFSISEWDNTRIQLVANVPNESGQCQIRSGDTIKVVVENPQTLLYATYKTQVQ